MAIGTILAQYEITSLLGTGGMGEVYRARDNKLKRDVAIKILPDTFSRDPERQSRFQREAEALAVLNHPNIAAIYDLSDANGWRFLVLELVEGETLADRLKDLWVLPLFGDRKPSVVTQTAFEENNGRFSPDGRWIASC